MFGPELRDIDLGEKVLRLHAYFDLTNGRVELSWIAKKDDQKEVTLSVSPAGPNLLQWTLQRAKRSLIQRSSGHLNEIRSNLRELALRFSVPIHDYSFSVRRSPELVEPLKVEGDPLEFVASGIRHFERQVREILKRRSQQWAGTCNFRIRLLILICPGTRWKSNRGSGAFTGWAKSILSGSLILSGRANQF